MSVLNRIAAFWRNLFRKGDVEQELSDELAYALDALVEKKIKGLPKKVKGSNF